jgi:hypothetical protein
VALPLGVNVLKGETWRSTTNGVVTGTIDDSREDPRAFKLGSVLGNAAEFTSTRLAALDGLIFMGSTDVVRRHAGSVGASASPSSRHA